MPAGSQVLQTPPNPWIQDQSAARLSLESQGWRRAPWGAPARIAPHCVPKPLDSGPGRSAPDGGFQAGGVLPGARQLAAQRLRAAAARARARRKHGRLHGHLHQQRRLSRAAPAKRACSQRFFRPAAGKSTAAAWAPALAEAPEPRTHKTSLLAAGFPAQRSLRAWAAAFTGPAPQHPEAGHARLRIYRIHQQHTRPRELR